MGVDNATDSIGFRMLSEKGSTALTHYGSDSSTTARIEIKGNNTSPQVITQTNDGSKTSTVTIGKVTTISPADSLRLKAVPAADADSVLGIRAYGSGSNTVVKIPKPGGTTITNATTTGDTLLTAANKIKRLDHDATLTFSTNANKILMGVDTISYVVTPSRLRDTAAALRAAIGSRWRQWDRRPIHHAPRIACGRPPSAETP